MTQTLIRTACAAVELWICYHLVPADTPDIPTVFLLSLRSADKFRLNTRIDQEALFAKFFRISLCRLTDQRSVVGENREKLRKEKGRIETKKERKEERKNVSIN